MTRNELSQKICEGISAVFGRAQQNSENWLYEQDFVRGRVAITERATGARDAMGICSRLEKEIGCGVKVSSASRADESYVFTIDFEAAKSISAAPKHESVYTDGKNTVASLEKDGKKYVVGKDGVAREVDDPDKYIANLNKTTGSAYRKAEDILDSRIEEACLALDGTGCKISREDHCLRITGAEAETLDEISAHIPEGDEYYGSGVETDDAGNPSMIIILPGEIFGVEEICNFIDNAVAGILDGTTGERKDRVEYWKSAIADAQPDLNMARRFSFAKNPGGLALALSDEKFAQAVASVRDAFGNKKAEELLGVRIGAKKARAVTEALGEPPIQGASSGEALESALDMLRRGFDGVHRASPGVSALIAGNMITKK